MPHYSTKLGDLGLDAATDLLNRGFADYLVPLRFTADAVKAMTRADQVDLDASRVVWDRGEPAGIALIARRDSTCRLAGMCLVPTARGRGHGHRLLDSVIADARSRGDCAMVLEVINQNEAALGLYRSAGFQTGRLLLGFTRNAESAVAEPAVHEHSIDAFAAQAKARELPDLPWQISAETLATVDPARHTACTAGGLWVLVGHLPNNTNLIRGILPTDTAGNAAALRAICAHWPHTTWRAGALFPTEWRTMFVDAGFEDSALSQTQMGLPLTPSQ